MDSTTTAPLRARDIQIGTELIEVTGRESWTVDVPQCPHSLADILPEHRRIAQALKGQPMSAVEFIEPEDARQAAEDARTELARLQAQGLRGFAAEKAHKRDEDVTAEDEERARDLYEDRIVELEQAAHDAPAQNATRRIEIPKSADQLMAELMASCCGEIFTLDGGKTVTVPKRMSEPEGELINLETPPELKAWILRGRGEYVQGRTGVDAPTLFAFVRQEARRFKSVAAYPHVPLLPDVHYRCAPHGERAYKPGEALGAALSMHNVESGEDNAIVFVAAAMSPGCGVPGYRPITVFQGKGEGVGKTSAANSIALMWGGMKARESAAMPRDKYRLAETMQELFFRMAGRIDRGIDLRVVLLDNIRGDLDLTELCSATSDPTVSQRVKGKKAGTDADNVFAWLATTNNVDPTGEVSRRLFTCTLAKPPAPKDGERSWQERSAEFFREHGWECVDDALEALAKYGDDTAYPVPAVGRHTTFKAYEDRLLWPAALFLADGNVDDAERLFTKGVEKIASRIAAQDSDAAAGQEAELAITQEFATTETEEGSWSNSSRIDYRKVPLETKPCYIKKTDLEHVCKRASIDPDQVVEAATAGKCDGLFFDDGIRQFPKKDRDGKLVGVAYDNAAGRDDTETVKIRRRYGLLYIPDDWDGDTSVQMLQSYKDPRGQYHLVVEGRLEADADVENVLQRVAAARGVKVERKPW